MQNQHSFSITFWINASRAKNDKAELYLRITVNQRRANISLKQKVPLQLWNSQKSRLKGSSPSSVSLNRYISDVHHKVLEIYRSLDREDKVITAKLIKSKFVGLEDRNKTLGDLMAYHNEKMKDRLNVNTLRHYKTSQRYLSEFVNKEYNKCDYFLKNLDYSFIVSFESFLRSYYSGHHVKNMSNNVVMKHLQRLRKMVTMSYHMEWISKDPFVKFKTRLEKRERPFLTVLELKAIEDLNIQIPRLLTVRDLFVFSCYTGLSYIDIINLKHENIRIGSDKNLWIYAIRTKSKTALKIPILNKAEVLISKYKKNNLNSDFVFPKYSNQKLNSYLKEIADLCQIEKSLTFHVARHTFATTITLSNGVPIETVSKLLGHTKLATTQIYAKVLEHKISKDMELLKVKLKSN
ncbi:site-specific integrase [Galbibacter sp. BG1]|uniref:site-specific integrase n=1 Tax=Galbibacter sp. BG1 TaxID=1170699 RepID=UPI0015BC7948|nr:site-specific integrase [Galbibacter sp. BG1]QLE01975.1 site-specific integrase [Galbibacter sp. BG1]